MRLYFLLVFFCAGIFGCGIFAGETRPNIIVIITDDQRPDTIHALGNEVIQTPNLDALAAGGFVFLRATNQGGNSGAVCIPSRAMLMSGQCLWRVQNNLDKRVTMGEFFGANGYATFGCGKWHNGDPSLLRTFQSAHGLTAGMLGNGQSGNYVHRAIGNGKIAPTKNTAGTHSTDVIGSSAVEFIKQRPAEGGPFFLYTAFNAPHDPREAPEAWVKKYLDANGKSTVPLPKNFMPAHPFDNGELKIRDEALLSVPRDADAVRMQLAIYYGMISHVDDWVGKIVATLKERGLYENTVIVFTSDHGLALGSHGLLGKQNVYEHSLRVPLIVRGPGVPAGKSAAFAYLYDLFPTLADFAGLTAKLPSPQVEGLNLRPVINGKAETVRTRTYHAYRECQRALREGDWKLIAYNVGGKKTTQLFDMANDADELKNLADDPARAPKLAELRKAMEEERTKNGDEGSAFWK